MRRFFEAAYTQALTHLKKRLHRGLPMPQGQPCTPAAARQPALQPLGSPLHHGTQPLCLAPPAPQQRTLPRVYGFALKSGGRPEAVGPFFPWGEGAHLQKPVDPWLQLPVFQAGVRRDPHFLRTGFPRVAMFSPRFALFLPRVSFSCTRLFSLSNLLIFKKKEGRSKGKTANNHVHMLVSLVTTVSTDIFGIHGFSVEIRGR